MSASGGDERRVFAPLRADGVAAGIRTVVVHVACRDPGHRQHDRHIDGSELPVDYGAFDHHVDVGAMNGSLAAQLKELARGVAAFFTDLGQHGERVTLVTTSEFGRRLEQNGSAGIDHGWGNVMMAVGGDVVGGYHASWPGLSQDRLQDGDVKVTTDFRQLLADVVQRRGPEVSVAQVFPGLTRASTGVIAGGPPL